MCKNIKRIWNAVTGVIVGAITILVLLLVGVRMLGLQVYTVLSGSMEPAYQTGSVIYVREADPQELEVGDVITFYLNEDTIATHRIIEIAAQGEEIRFRTKGDANDVADGFVDGTAVIGTPIFTIPYLGYLAVYIQTLPGKYIAIAAGAAVLLLVFLPELIFDDKKSKNKEAS